MLSLEVKRSAAPRYVAATPTIAAFTDPRLAAIHDTVDPAPGMDIARHRPSGDRVHWIDADMRRLQLRPGDDDGGMDDAVRDYIDAIDPEHRPLFDRLHRLILESHPDAEVVLSYQMPTYKVDRYRLYVGAWKHGLSLYGWDQGRDGGFIARHPELATGKGTIRMRPDAAAGIIDDELRDLVRGALGGYRAGSTPDPSYDRRAHVQRRVDTEVI